MKEFLLIFRNNHKALPSFSPDEMQATTKKWMDWIGSIAAQNKLSNRGNRLASTGKVVKPHNVITDGPYSEIKESVGGYSIIKADSYEEAVEIARGCPVLTAGGNVEIRAIDQLEVE